MCVKLWVLRLLKEILLRQNKGAICPICTKILLLYKWHYDNLDYFFLPAHY
jgi:hypothetical protein